MFEAGNVGHAMEFEWTSEGDSENYRNLNSLAKYNNGIYKSYKQQQFLHKKWGWTLPSFNSQLTGGSYSGDLRDDAAFLLSIFGVTIVPGQRVISPSGYMRWSQYGGRGNRPIQWMFVLDEYGVAAKYKLKFKGDMKSGTTVDAAGTKLEWERDASAATTLINTLAQGKNDEALQKQQAAANRIPSKHLGNVGDRIKGQAAEILMSFGPRSGQFGDYYINKLVTPNAEELLYFGNKLGNKGDKVVLSFTVGKHDTDSKTQEPITLIKRPKKVAAPVAVAAPPAPASGAVGGEPKMLTPSELRQKDFEAGKTRESVEEERTVWVKGPGGSLKKKVIPDTDAQKVSKLRTLQRQQRRAEEEYNHKRMAPIEDKELDWGRLQKIFTTGEYPGPGGEIIDIVSRQDTKLTINGKQVAGKKLGVYFGFESMRDDLPADSEPVSDRINITVYRDPQKPSRLKATYF